MPHMMNEKSLILKLARLISALSVDVFENPLLKYLFQSLIKKQFVNMFLAIYQILHFDFVFAYVIFIKCTLVFV